MQNHRWFEYMENNDLKFINLFHSAITELNLLKKEFFCV